MTGILDILNTADGELLLFFNRAHNSFFDMLMYAISNKWVWVPLYGVILWFLILKEQWGAVVAVVCISVGVAVSDQLCSSFLRHTVERLRPANPANPISEFVHIVNGYRGGSFGFPSSHAANTFTLAMFISLVYKRRRVAMAMFGWALLVSYSRMYLGVHYPGDILAGAVIGCGVGFLAWYVFSYFKRSSLSGRFGTWCTRLVSR